MNKAQAVAIVNACEGAKLPCDLVLRFDQAGAELWNLQFDPSHSYSGADLSAIANYCATNGLTLTAVFTALGVV